MTHKTIQIKGCKTCNAVHVFLDINKDVDKFVRILAWHDDGDDLFCQEATVTLSSADDALLVLMRYIADFSEASANDFANSMVF